MVVIHSRAWTRKKCSGLAVGIARSKRAAKQTHFDQNPVDQLRRLTARYRSVRVPGLPPLIAGAIGYFSYDMVRLVERIPDTGRDDVGADDCVMMFYLGLLAFDHVKHRVWVIRNVFTEGPGSLRAKYDAAISEIRRTRRLLERPLPPTRSAGRLGPLRVRSNMTKSKVHQRGEESQGIHSSGRCVPNRCEPAVRGANKRKSSRYLSRTASRESVAIPLLSEAARFVGGGKLAGDACKTAGTRSLLSPSCRHSTAGT